MQFRTKIVTFALLLAFGAALCATITLVLARGIENGMRSVTLAENQLALYLAMETDVSDLLRLHLTSTIVPSEEMASRLSATRAAIFDDIETIRAYVSEERRFRGREELEELVRLDRISATLEDIENTFARISTDRVGPQSTGVLAGPVINALDQMDGRLAPLVDLAIADEAGEVLEAREKIARLSRRSVQTGTAAGIVTLLAALVGAYLLLTAFMRPFDAVVTGASRLAEGELGYRIPPGYSGEFGRLSRDFNAMAARLQESDCALRAEEETLQQRVAARTAELEQANARLAEQDAIRRRFLADVSHELRTPLTVMRGESEVALRARDASMSAEARDALTGVVDQTEHMSRLVDDLLFVARQGSGDLPLSLETVDTGAILRAAIHDATRLGSGDPVILQADDTVLGTRIHVDPGRIHQLLMVLLDNALRYSPGNRDVRLSARRSGDGIEIAVRDRGIGIPAADLPEVFDRFVRGSNASPGGTGLGLPVALAIAEAHGGTLAIDSSEGQGTTVTLSLPVMQQDGEHDAETSAS